MLNTVERVVVGDKVRCGGSVEKGRGEGEWMTTGGEKAKGGKGWFFRCVGEEGGMAREGSGVWW